MFAMSLFHVRPECFKLLKETLSLPGIKSYQKENLNQTWVPSEYIWCIDMPDWGGAAGGWGCRRAVGRWGSSWFFKDTFE